MTRLPASQVRVWDPLLRICHWALVLLVLAAWFTRHGGGRWHEWLGYGAGAVIGLRFVWGWIGPEHARFTSFLHSPARTLRYARQVLSRSEPHFLGHNPLGGCMAVFLLVAVASTVATGWLYVTDAFWGEQWLEELHAACADAVLGLAAVHVLGVVFTSLRQRENLVSAMLHGRKRPR